MILIIIILFALLYLNNKEHFGATTDTLNFEAVRNLSSLYNTNNLSATNITASNKLNLNTKFSLSGDSDNYFRIRNKDGKQVLAIGEGDDSYLDRLYVNSINLLPRGLIVAWSGSYTQIPTGWLLCDGTNGTPDLRGKFVYGAGAAAGTATGMGVALNALPIGYTGGSDSVKLTSNQIPLGNYANIAVDPGSAYGVFGSPITTNNPVSIMPPYYALAWIMKA